MVGERLRQARETLCLTLAQVAELSTFSTTAISAYENGDREPRLAQLSRLATVYHRPTEWFIREQEGAPAGQVLWRKKPVSGAELVEARFLELCRWYGQLERLTGQQSQLSLPEQEQALDASQQGYARARLLASEIREMLALGSYPAFGLLSVLEERCGIKVFQEEFQPSGTAACVRSPEFGAGVLLNAEHRRWRRNYDLAHELFHLVTWKAVAGAQLTPDQWQEQEKLADVFASHLLLPTEAFDAAVTQVSSGGQLTVAGVIDLARKFDVSVDVVCWRLKFIYRWEKQKTEALIERCREAQIDAREDAPQGSRRPARFLALARRAARRGLISTGRLAQYAGVSRTEALDWVAGAGGEDEEVQAPLA